MVSFPEPPIKMSSPASPAKVIALVDVFTKSKALRLDAVVFCTTAKNSPELVRLMIVSLAFEPLP